MLKFSSTRQQLKLKVQYVWVFFISFFILLLYIAYIYARLKLNIALIVVLLFCFYECQTLNQAHAESRGYLFDNIHAFDKVDCLPIFWRQLCRNGMLAN